MTLTATALDAARRGHAVFPCVPNAKRPLVKWGQEATNDPDTLNRWWARWPRANVGVACHASGLVVVDLDISKPDTVRPDGLDADIANGIDVFTRLLTRLDQPWPATYTIRTPRGGLHLYFARPDGVHIRNAASDKGAGIGWLIDIRGGGGGNAGGYVVGAGSLVDGRPYTVARSLEVAPLPGWLNELLRPPPPPPRRRFTGPPPRIDSGYIATALKGEIQRILDSTAGVDRNNNLNVAAFNLGTLIGAGLLDRTTALIALRQAGEAVGLGDREVRATVDSGLGKGTQQPRQLRGAR